MENRNAGCVRKLEVDFSETNISNSNWIEWSTIQGVIARVISKTYECEARDRFEITSTITPFIKSILKSLVVPVI